MALRLRGRHSLGDFLNDSFALVPLVWKKALPVSLAALAPGIALWIATMGSLVRWIKAIVAEAGSIGSDPSLVLSGFAPFLALAMLATLALYLGQAYQKAFVCAQAGAAIEGRAPGFRELAASAFRPAWLRVAVQDAVVGSLASSIALGIIAGLFFPFFFGKLGEIVRLKESGDAGIGLIVSFLAVYLGSILVAEAAVWWLRVKTCVSAPASVIERVNSFAGIGRSLELVRGREWRIFGCMFIVSLVISFGLGILTGPITFVVIMPGYFSFLKSSLSGETPSPESIIAFLSSMSWGLGVTMLISGVVQGCLWPSFLTLLHADLRIRAGELDAAPEEAPAGPAPSVGEAPAPASAPGESEGPKLG
jgi:hypothetical protein